MPRIKRLPPLKTLRTTPSASIYYLTNQSLTFKKKKLPSWKNSTSKYSRAIICLLGKKTVRPGKKEKPASGTLSIAIICLSCWEKKPFVPEKSELTSSHLSFIRLIKWKKTVRPVKKRGKLLASRSLLKVITLFVLLRKKTVRPGKKWTNIKSSVARSIVYSREKKPFVPEKKEIISIISLHHTYHVTCIFDCFIMNVILKEK